MTEPTDKQLEAFAVEEQFLLFCDADEFTQIARAVLAKWGSLPAVMGEPVGYCHEIKWRAHQSEQVQKITRKAHPEYGYTQALYTTPQPPQAQAGAVPLTNEQIEDLLICGNPTDEEKRLIRMGWDAAHGIKGGQHGTE